MEEDVEVIFESWMLKLTGLEGRSTFRLSSHWKKRYFILLRQHESASLLYYNHKPSNLEETPKGIIVLEPYYRVEKRYNVRSQHYVVALTTPSKRLVVAVDDERIFHLFAFFLQVQIKLNDDLEDECFVVRPDNSDDQRRIGARGNLCLLHVSQWGITAALQLSKCVMVQWPLSCIRNYESTGRGQFIVTVGKRASMGVGRYVFSTRLGQDNLLYDRLDRYVLDASGLRHSHADNISQTSAVETENLHQLTYVQANPQFSNHLRKISRDIYDSLWQHLGSTRLLKASNPDLLSDSPHARQRAFTRSASTATLDGAPSVPTTPRQSLRRKFSSPVSIGGGASPLASPGVDFSSLPRNFRRTQSASSKLPSREDKKKKRIPVDMIESHYLHAESPYAMEDFDLPHEDPGIQQVKRPPPSGANTVLGTLGAGPGTTLGRGAGAVTGKPPSGNNNSGNNGKLSARSPSASTSSDPMGTSMTHLRLGSQRPRLQRLQSRSCEDLITYMEMDSPTKGGNEYVYNNHSVETGEEEGEVNDTPDGQVYSYATQDEIEQTRAAAQKLAQRRLQDNNNGGAPVAHNNGNRDPVPTGFIRKPLIRQSSMKKAMSNPTLIDNQMQRWSHECSSPESPRSPTTPHPYNRERLANNVRYPKSITNQGRTEPTNSSPTKTNSTASPLGGAIVSMTSQVSAMTPQGSPMTSRVSVMTSQASPMTSRAHFNTGRPKGIHTTNKTKVFRKPSPDQSPIKVGFLQQNQFEDEEQESSRRQESISSGYASGGPEQDLRETHC